MAKRLGELLVRESKITIQQLQKAEEDRRRHGGRLGAYLTKLGFIEENELVQFLSKQYGLPSINLEEFDIDPEIIKLIPKEMAEKHLIIPVNRAGATLVIAMGDPSNVYAVDEVKFSTNLKVEMVVASDTAIQDAIRRYYEEGRRYDQVMEEIKEAEIEFSKDGEDDVNVVELEKSSEDAPVVKLVNLILLDAIAKHASDIHVEPYEKLFRVRYRIDGVLYEVMSPPLKLKNAITSRLKIMSALDIAERRLPQDGRIKLRVGADQEMDFRVSVLPTLFGEKVVMRLLDKSNLELDMTKLGFEAAPLALFKEAIHRPFGMVLVTGPTGSGKTTSLYSALSELNKTTENISTAEDPVEYNLTGINQVHMKEDIGLNFAAALRSFLRQDPDIIMVGEIRDFETAEIAVKAALTGHLVLSTLHTNDAPSTVSRLLNMGVEPFLVTASTNLIMAQRLVRRLCQECKAPVEVPVKAMVEAGMKEDVAKTVSALKGQGCRTCSNTGYKGRVALYEVMPFYEELKEIVLQGGSASELKHEAIRMGMKTLRQAGLSKLQEGMTSLEEVLRVTAPD